MAGVHSALAPASTSTAGVRPSRGSGVAMQGRTTLGSRPMRRSAEAMVAPVLPAETMADALPSRTSSAARTSDESFFRLTPPAASSSMAMTSVHATSSSPMVSPTCSGGPTRTMQMPCSAAARLAPSTISPGALSPPMASTATGSFASASGDGRSPRRLKSVDLDGLATLVPTAAGADHVRCLRGLAVRAHAAGRPAEPPGASQVAAALGLGLLLLGDCHERTPTIGSGRSGCAQRHTWASGTVQALRKRLPEHVEVSPPGVPGGNAAAVALVAVGSALGAQAGAVLLAQRRHRQLEHHGVSHHRGQVDLVEVDRVEVLVARAGHRQVGEALVHRDEELALHPLGAAPARPDPGGTNGALHLDP